MVQATGSDKMFSNPIIFNIPEHVVDTRLKVFEVEFHVHSLLLKIGSAYFRKFFDSADKVDSPATPTFRYEYRLLLTTTAKHEISGMKSMLEAIYGRPFELQNLEALQTLARLADFYGALPIISTALDGALIRSLNLISEIPNSPLEFLTVANRFRNKLLYKESMIHVAGQWKGHHGKLVEQPELRKYAIIAYSNLCDKLDTANQAILHIIAKSTGGQTIIADYVKQYTTVWSSKNFKSLASYCRHLYSEEYKSTPLISAPRNYNARDSVALFQKALRPVLENNLVLEQSKNGAGQGKFIDCFLCTDVPDEDLPWDPSQTDW